MKRSFRDRITGVLVASGYMTTNQLGDLVREEPESFNLEAGRWRWDGTEWVAHTPPPSYRNVREMELRTAIGALIDDVTVSTTVKDAIVALARFVKDESNGQ